MTAQKFYIVLDFDGTVVKHRYPAVGEDIGAVPVLQRVVKNGHQLLLNTMRSPCGSNNDVLCRHYKALALHAYAMIRSCRK